MKPCVISNISKIVAIAGAVLGFSQQPSLAQVATPTATLIVAVFSDRYVSAGRTFDDLDTLEAWVNPKSPRIVRLYSCEPAAADPLLAAAHRFRHVYLDLQSSVQGQPRCKAAAAIRTVKIGPASSVSVNESVSQYWLQVRP